ncbi:sugar ABC transporter substrate-binding protein [Amnibacterium sp. CER49]|uniref:ABC transporter substrate-binding protein n=1 Tax=Amnibacterium sp. CER49 TaxID=3039161 RepID=UPI00244BC590|nr:sugar ABC transporter substrate-binding protein [Amnibacterium sp. CER49]MDH2444659.1 sugar ABC transporter substrate-binding protein [Amnibacterium sp. CER49]
MNPTRRTVLAGAGAVSLSTLLASCAGFTGQSNQGSGKGGSGSKTLSFTTWGSDQEKTAYQQLIKEFEAANKGVTVKLSIVPYEQAFTNLDAQLQAGKAPDIFRLGYGQIGGYSDKNVLLDLSPYFSSSEADAFQPQFWQAVKYQGKPYGVPQQTDTSALVYNTKMLKDAGITSVPDSLENAWSFDEFTQVLEKLRKNMDAKHFPFADNWQLAGAFRWLTWLFSTGGRILSSDLKSPAIVSPQGTKALDYTRDFFAKQYVPQNNSTKSNTYADTTWLAGTTAMVSAGTFLLPGFTGAKFEWGVTYLPKDVRGADDLGGNALVASAASPNKDLAARFLKFMVSEKAMSTMCVTAFEQPTLKSLVGKDLGWKIQSGVMPVYLDQATTITPDDVAQISIPQFTSINTTLTNELEAAFRQGQSTSKTLSNIADGVTKALRS